MNAAQTDLIQYRMERAKSTLRDAELLRGQGGSLWSVANRAYYAMFYAALAMLLTQGKGASKHSGVLSLFDLLFVKTGRFPKEFSRLFHRAFELRQMGDYRDLLELDEQQVDELLAGARRFVAAVESTLRDYLERDL